MDIPQMYYVYVKDADGSVTEWSGLCIEVVADKFVTSLKSSGAEAWKVMAKPNDSLTEYRNEIL